MRNRMKSLNGKFAEVRSACILLWFARAGSAARIPAKDKTPRTKSGFVTTGTAQDSLLEAGHGKDAGGKRRPAIRSSSRLPRATPRSRNRISFHSFSSSPVGPCPLGSGNSRSLTSPKIFTSSPWIRAAQGESSQTHEGLYPAVRARDIKAVVDQLHLAPVVLVGWSMGVTEIAAYLDQFGSQDLAAIVLVDGYAGGTDPAEAVPTIGVLKSTLEDRKNFLASFMQNVMFKKPQPEGYIARLTAASNITPTDAAVALLVGMHATDYKPALLKNTKPVLICVADGSMFTRQLEDLHKRMPGARYEVFPGAGHTIFVDEPDKFNTQLEDFLHALI